MKKPTKASQIVIAPRNIGDPYAPKPMTEEEIEAKKSEWLATHTIKRSPGRTWSRYNILYPKYNTYIFSSTAGWTDGQMIDKVEIN